MEPPLAGFGGGGREPPTLGALAAAPCGMAAPGATPPSVDEAQESVEFLCQRFAGLFAELHREEADRKATEARNEQLERQLAELQWQGLEDAAAGKAEADAKRGQVADLRREADAAEKRAELEGGEADALATASATYAAQAARLKERFLEESAREQSAAQQLAFRGEELRDLKAQRSELSAAVDGAEAEEARVAEELRLVVQSTAQTSQEIGVLEKRLDEQRRRCEDTESGTRAQRGELTALDQRLGHAHADLEILARQLETARAEGREKEAALLRQAEARGRFTEELQQASAQLGEWRREEFDHEKRFAGGKQETQRIRDLLHAERQRQQAEQRNAEAARSRLETFRNELPPARAALQNAESELVELRQRIADMEERCAAQRGWRDELKHKQSTSEVALERLREELRILGADRVRLVDEVDEAARERTRLEVEVEVSIPALQDARRRSRDLEERLTGRVRELSDEVEKVRRCKAEASSARAKLQALERGAVGSRTPREGEMPLREMPSRERASSQRRAHFAPQAVEEPAAPPARSQHLLSLQPHLVAGRLGAATPPPSFQFDGPPMMQPSPKGGATPWAHSSAAPSLPSPSGAGTGGREDSTLDAVRFLCEFVAKEEERLGFSSRTPR